jgi:hypothetical protein
MEEKPNIELLEKEAHESKADVQAMVDETIRRVREQSEK